MSHIDRLELIDFLKERLDRAITNLIAEENEEARGKIKELKYLITEFSKPLNAA